MDEEETEEWNKYNHLVRNQDISVQDRGRGFQQNYPSSELLKKQADRLNLEVGKKNNDPVFHGEIPRDTTSVSRTNKPEFIIAGNLKERRKTETNDKNKYVSVRLGQEHGGGKEKAVYESNGINRELAEFIGNVVKKSDIYRNSNLGVKVIEETRNPSNNKDLPNMMDKAKDHATRHAEMKTMAYCRKDNALLKSIGISKPACKGCFEELNKVQTDVSPVEAGQKKVSNWGDVDEDDVEVLYQINRNTEVQWDMKMYSNNINFNREAIKGVMKDNFNIKRCMKPGGSVGLISGYAVVMDTIKTNNFNAYTNFDVFTQKAGVTENICGIGEVAYAKASVVEATTGFGGIAGVAGSVLSVSAHAEYGLNNSVGVGASIVRGEAYVGPAVVGVGLNLTTEAHVGVNGIGASVLGMGFNFGIRMQISTPFFDFSLNLF